MAKFLTEEHKRRIGAANAIVLKGRKLPEATRAKMMGRIPWNKGTKGVMQPNKTSFKKGVSVSPNTQFKKGEESPNWKGGVSSHPKYRSFIHIRRVVRKLENGGNHSLGEWDTLKAQYNWTCPACKRKEPEIKLTEDHIIPLVKGGSDNIENIQPLCRSCNSKKKVQVIKYEIA
jgi:hypothetical protein